MKTSIKQIAIIGSLLLMIVLSTGKFSVANLSPWVAPAWADTIHNPLKGSTTASAAGKLLYDKYCVVCHGAKGKGDGVAAPGLQVHPADHSSTAVQSQTDGAIYWKLTTGRPPMASYKTTLTATQRWQLVDYIRTLAATPK